MPWSAFTSRKQSPFSSLGSVLLTHPASPWGRATQQVHTKTFSHPSLSLSLSLSLRSVAWFWSSVCRSRPGGSPGGIPHHWGSFQGITPGDPPKGPPQRTPAGDPPGDHPYSASPFSALFPKLSPRKIPPKGSPQHIPSGDPPGDPPQGTGDSPRGPPQLIPPTHFLVCFPSKPPNTLMCESFCTNPTCNADATCPHGKYKRS